MRLTRSETITAAFTRPEGFRFARWSVPVAPMVYGLDDASTALMKSGIRLICDLTGHPFEEGDPSRGYNHVTLHCASWAELRDLPPLGPGIDPAALADELTARDLPRHQVQWFGEDGGIVRVLQLVRVGPELADLPADLLALCHALMPHLAWGPDAFTGGLTEAGAQGLQLRADLLNLVRVAYDPALPVASQDPSLAFRLAARLAAKGLA